MNKSVIKPNKLENIQISDKQKLKQLQCEFIIPLSLKKTIIIVKNKIIIKKHILENRNILFSNKESAYHGNFS